MNTFDLVAAIQADRSVTILPDRSLDSIVGDAAAIAALAKSEAQFRSLVENTSDLIYSITPDGIFTYISPQIQAICGYQPSELIGQSCSNFTHPDDLPMMIASNIELVETGRKQDGLEIRVPRKDGSWCPIVFNSSAITASDGTIVGIHGIGRDITVQKAILQARQRQENALKAIVEGTVGKTGKEFYQACTKYIAEIFDVRYAFLTKILDNSFTKSQMLSLWIGGEFLEPYEMNLVGTPCLETYQNDWGIFTHDLQSRFPTATVLASLNGESYLSVVIRDFEGNILGNLGIIDTKPLPQDTSTIEFIIQLFANRVAAEMKRQTDEDKLIETNQELQRATRRKDQFLATMSHELRTPLTAILGLSEALKARVFGSLNERQIKSIDTIERSGEHLLSLINDILDVSKISAGKLELDISTVTIAALCDASLAFVRQQALDKQIELDLRLGLPLEKQIAVDERRMRQVLINLLSNAVKFTPAGGRITLKVTAPLRGIVELAVIDTGIGIPSHQQRKLFQPFVQLDSSLSRQYEGIGLGLTLVKQIVELHGGKVSLESEIDLGSCFTLELPDSCVVPMLEPNLSMSRSSLGSDPALEIAQISAATILLVEDNQANIDTFSGYLIANGYRMLIAKNGLAAIELTQIQQPDLILMDIQMPGINGLEAIKAIRQLPNCCQLPIIALTARSMPGEWEKCLEAGASSYLAKPVKLKELHRTIQHYQTAIPPK